MRWATRTGPHVDRTACAWLIARFVDPQAEFVFVSDPDDVPADATAFDIRGVELIVDEPAQQQFMVNAGRHLLHTP